jgi:hypothetical protein
MMADATVEITVQIRTTDPYPMKVAQAFEALLNLHYLPDLVRVTRVAYRSGNAELVDER